MAMSTPQGLRERKKERTRQQIAETARSLFSRRGFDRVTVAEIARAADVSEQTVFNYFPRKEDLVYWRLESFEEELLATIRDRPAGESVLAAFARFVLRPRGLLAEHDAEARKRLGALTRMIMESPALLAREQEVLAGYTAALAALIAEERGEAADEVEPWVVANALMGVHRALMSHARRRVVEGAEHERLAAEVRERGERALALLADGLGGYLVAPDLSRRMPAGGALRSRG
jgi:AcrR family transcriptional regulator